MLSEVLPFSGPSNPNPDQYSFRNHYLGGTEIRRCTIQCRQVPTYFEALRGGAKETDHSYFAQSSDRACQHKKSGAELRPR